jgi:hypothetical protein
MSEPNLSARWKKAKGDFQKITGEKKPKAKGFVASTLGHSGIDGAFKDADKYCHAVENTPDPKKKMKLVLAAMKHTKKLDKVTADYIKFVKAKMKDEEADRNQRTTYTKALDFLADRLDHLDQLYDTFLDNHKIAMNQELSGMQKFTKMMYKSLATTIANASAGVKKVKADPTPETFREIYGGSDNIARKVQVQMVQAATGQKKGLLPELMIDPRFVADKMTPWQAGGKGSAVCAEDDEPQVILAKNAEFEKLLKLCGRFLVDLNEKAPRG